MAALASRVERSWKGAEGACWGVQQQAPAWGLCGTRKLVRWAMLHCWQCSEGWAGSSCDAEMLTECREAKRLVQLCRSRESKPGRVRARLLGFLEAVREER